MKCPKCNGKTKVVDSRTNGSVGSEAMEPGVLRRKRECVSCDFKGTTYEMFDYDLKDMTEETVTIKVTRSRNGNYSMVAS